MREIHVKYVNKLACKASGSGPAPGCIFFLKNTVLGLLGLGLTLVKVRKNNNYFELF